MIVTEFYMLSSIMAVWEDLPPDLRRRIRVKVRCQQVAHEVAVLEQDEHILVTLRSGRIQRVTREGTIFYNLTDRSCSERVRLFYSPIELATEIVSHWPRSVKRKASGTTLSTV